LVICLCKNKICAKCWSLKEQKLCPTVRQESLSKHPIEMPKHSKPVSNRFRKGFIFHVPAHWERSIRSSSLCKLPDGEICRLSRPQSRPYSVSACLLASPHTSSSDMPAEHRCQLSGKERKALFEICALFFEANGFCLYLYCIGFIGRQADGS